ncbi:MAG: transcription termination/antitermination factor NusG [Kiritimatiellae bacterium]|nr:transcription termination/antitermination factor NusG [Kiritimatiellia bacterium]
MMDLQMERVRNDFANIPENEGMGLYVVHTLTGQEKRAQTYLANQCEAAELGGSIGVVILPLETVYEVKDKKRTKRENKFFPGYLFVQARLYGPDPARPRHEKLNVDVWRFVTNAPGIIGFLGGDHPHPLTQREISDLSDQAKGAEGKARVKIDYKIGEMVLITDGAFKGSEGPIDMVDPDRGKLNVTVTVFGRPTPVELEHWQVERKVVDGAGVPG